MVSEEGDKSYIYSTSVANVLNVENYTAVFLGVDKLSFRRHWFLLISKHTTWIGRPQVYSASANMSED